MPDILIKWQNISSMSESEKKKYMHTQTDERINYESNNYSDYFQN